MKSAQATPANIDEYIAAFPVDVQELLQSVRHAVREAAPEAGETISYQIPTFTLHGNLIHFAAFKNHIGIYPGASAIAAFRDELLGYRTARGTVQFPLNKPIPLALVKKIVRFCKKERTRPVKNRNTR